MNYDFTTLASIMAASNELNTNATAWGLDFDLELRPDDNRGEVSFWKKDSGEYERVFYQRDAMTADGLATILWAANSFLSAYGLRVRDELTAKIKEASDEQ